MDYTALKVIFLFVFTNCLVHCDNHKTIKESEPLTVLLKSEDKWIKEISDIIRVKRGAYHLLQLRSHEISQTLELDKSQILVSISKSFTLAVRFTKLWPIMRSLMMDTFGKSWKLPDFPVNVPKLWWSAGVSLLRIQQTQNISAETLATSMEGPYHSKNRIAATCYDVGLFFYQMKHAHRATEWFLAALRRAQGQEGKDLRLQVLEYLHLAQCFKGDSKGSSKTLRTLLEDYPRFNPNLKLRDDYNLTANSSCSQLAWRIKPSKELIDAMLEDQKYTCQHQSENPSILKYMKCYIMHFLFPHNKIQPLQLEELRRNPPLVLLHGTIRKREMDDIKNMFGNAVSLLFQQDC